MSAKKLCCLVKSDDSCNACEEEFCNDHLLICVECGPFCKPCIDKREIKLDRCGSCGSKVCSRCATSIDPVKCPNCDFSYYDDDPGWDDIDYKDYYEDR